MGCRRSDDSAELRGDMTEEETDRLLHANLGRLEAIAAAGGQNRRRMLAIVDHWVVRR